MNEEKELYQSVVWTGEFVEIIDQTRLPSDEVILPLKSAEAVWEAIRQLKVRGAPAIGIAGAYGLYLGVKESSESNADDFFKRCTDIANYLNSSRPTAVNLSWALNKILRRLEDAKDRPVAELKSIILESAIEIHQEDRKLCKTIGETGAGLFQAGSRILTHCNTGGLATGQYGTAFSVIYHAHRAGHVDRVWVDETRPLLQGARLTTWELQKAEIPFSLIVDSAAGFLMQQGKVDAVIIGADRITANGDTANKIGSYSLAVLASAHNIPFYVAAPYSTIDLNLSSGNEIAIEERPMEEVTHVGGKQTAPGGVEVYNPAFDVTPNHLITAIITERGVIEPDYTNSIARTFSEVI